jgi:hypothetical protein
MGALAEHKAVGSSRTTGQADRLRCVMAVRHEQTVQKPPQPRRVMMILATARMRAAVLNLLRMNGAAPVMGSMPRRLIGARGCDGGARRRESAQPAGWRR